MVDLFDSSSTHLSRRRTPVGCLLIAAAVFLAYWPSIQGQFLLDDDLLLTDNQLVKASDGLHRIWFTREPVDYWPVTNSVFWIEWRLFGMNPTGYHVTNLLLHTANCLLIWLLMRRLAIPGGFLAGLFFALHPVNVESVAWISELKNVLSMCLLLVALVWFVRSLQRDGPVRAGADRKRFSPVQVGTSHQRPWYANPWYWLSLGAFTFAMLAKGSVATGPGMLLLIVWWQRGRIRWSDVWSTVPFFAIAALLTLVNIWFQARDWGEGVRQITWLQRWLGAGGVVWFYLLTALMPINLQFIYPQWHIDPSSLLWWLPLIAAVAVTAFLLFFCWRRPNNQLARGLFFAWALYGLALAPVMGFADIGFMRQSLVANHFIYIALVPVLGAVAGFWTAAELSRSRLWRIGLLVPALVAVCICAIMTHQRAYAYSNALSFYEEMVRKNPESYLAQNNLAVELSKSNRYDLAMDHWREALRINPDSAESYNGLGIAYMKQGHLSEATELFQKAVKASRYFAEAHFNLGTALRDAGRSSEAIQEFETAVRLKPSYYEALNNLANELNRTGRLPDAIRYYREAIRLNPDVAAIHYNLGNALENSNQPAEAVNEYLLALRLEPDDAGALANLASAYADLNRVEDAIKTAKIALNLARSKNQTELADQIEAWLKDYQTKHNPR